MRRKLIITLSTIAGLAALHTLVWREAVSRLDQEYQDWRSSSQQAGWTVAADAPMRGGWPFAATLTLPHTTVRVPASAVPGGIGWQADRLVLRIAFVKPATLEILPQGVQQITLAGLPPVPAEAGALSVWWPLHSGAKQAELRARDARVGATGLGFGMLALGDLILHVDWSVPATLSLRVESVHLPTGRDWPLGPRLSSVAVDAVLKGERGDAGRLMPMLATWRDHGGSLTLSHFALGWGPLGLSGDAVASLDGGMQPNGTANLHVLGAAKSLDLLVSHGLITASAATAARGVVALLSKTPDGGEAQLDIPLTLVNGTASAAGIPFARTGPLF